MHKNIAKTIYKISKSKFLKNQFGHRLNLLYQSKFLFSIQFKQSQFPQKTKEETQFENQGTDYTNWILSRSQRHNHNISHLRRKFLKDRFSIHKLTNIKFLCALVNRKNQYTLNINEKIILLAQLNHIFNLLNKDKTICLEFNTLIEQIIVDLKDPHDLVCLGTFLASISNIGHFNYSTWESSFDSLIVKKYDEQYDQIFGIVCSLNAYKQWILNLSSYESIQKNVLLQLIAVIYRNNLQLIRQFVKFNVYNLKQCRLLFRCLFKNNINERYFWQSINDWFNIYIKEQLSKKDFDEYFIVSERAIQKVINDDGMIRPRSILQQVSQIAYFLSQNKMHSKRFIKFVQNIVVYSIENGSNLFQRYLKQFSMKEQVVNLRDLQIIQQNEQFKTTKQEQKQRIQLMQKKYKTLFINPIQIKNQWIIYLLVILKDFKIQMENNKQKQNKTSRYDQQINNYQLDQRLLKWLLILLCKPQMSYTIAELIKIIQCFDLFKFAKINLETLIIQKIKNLRSLEVSLTDLSTIMNFLPLQYFPVLNDVIQTFLKKSHPSYIYQFTKKIEHQSVSSEDQYGTNVKRKQQNQKWVAYLDNYFLKLPQIVNFHQKYFSFQQNCYFLYYLLKNQIYWQDKIQQGNYLGQMQKLKESVKTASYSRGFKLQMGSYFYKLLNYVDLVEFFEGGNV